MFDGSGYVTTTHGIVRFDRLNTFAQGYVVASSEVWPAGLGFQNLAPETLRAILRDCQAFEAENPDASGAEFWALRNSDLEPDDRFPPLAYFVENGQLHLMEGTLDHLAEGDPYANDDED
ncbi:hypothetical protein [Phenylobacterium immobile]|uniref:hypothetical protein n=1 Tax=Phenylobacterium immobile TaxID=21 RepID=UPI000A74E0F7|nr:hypothetical protein [Phenylobacterium immobile]